MTPDANGLCVFAVKRGNFEKRLDPHFYLPEYQNIVKKIQGTTQYTTIGSIANFSKETTDFSEFKNGTFEYLEISGVELGENSYSTSVTDVSQAPSRAKMKTQKGDIAISTTRPHRGAVVEIQTDKIIASTGFSIIRELSQTVDKKWFLHILLTSIVLKQMLQRSSGGNYPAIIEDEIKNVYIPLLELPKQKLMADSIENALNKKRDLIQCATNKLEEFYNNVASILKINTERKNRLCYAIKLKDLDGVIDAKRYASVTAQTSKFMVSDICEIVNEKINVTRFGKQAIDWIRIDDLPNQPLDIEEIRTQPTNEVEGTFFEVQEDDILVARLGPTILNQKIVMVRSLERTTIASAEFLVLRCKDGYNPEAVMAVLKTTYYRDLMYSHARGSTPSRYRLNREDMLKLPFPDIREHQERIAVAANGIREQVKNMRIQAEQDWQAAKEQFEKELLGE